MAFARGTTPATVGSMTASSTASSTCQYPDFVLTATPKIATGFPNVTYTLTVSSMCGLYASVHLQIQELPPNSTFVLNPEDITLPAGRSVNSTLTIFASEHTPRGPYTIFISGTASLPTITITKAVSVLFMCAVERFPYFSVSVIPSHLTIRPSTEGNASVIVSSFGFASPINLTLSDVPAHVTYSFSPNQLTLPFNGNVSSILTLAIGSDAVSGNYSLSVTGVSEGFKDRANITLTIPQQTTNAIPGFSPESIAAGFLLGLALIILVRVTARPLQLHET